MFNLKKFTYFSIICSVISGILLHYTYHWSNNNPIVAAFSATNESTWEHLKLVFYPLLVISIVGYIIFKNKFPNFLCCRTAGLLVALVFIPIFFYTYTGILGKDISILDISSFFLAIILNEIVCYKLIKRNFVANKKICIGILLVLLFSFVIFTYNTPNLGVFRDPITMDYGPLF